MTSHVTWLAYYFNTRSDFHKLARPNQKKSQKPQRYVGVAACVWSRKMMDEKSRCSDEDVTKVSMQQNDFSCDLAGLLFQHAK
jgi:hypothetical protein